jgi:hypothetical protein
MVLTTIGQALTLAQAEYESKYARRKRTEESAESSAIAVTPELATEVVAHPAPPPAESSPA